MITLDPVVSWTLRLGLGLLFGSATWHKLRAPAGFAAAVRAYRLVPERAVVPVAGVLVLSEAMTTGLLLGPASYRLGAALAAALSALYAGAIAANLARGRRDLDCGCAAPGARRPVSAALVVRNVVLIAAALLLLGPGSGRAITWVDVVTVLAATATGGALWAGVGQLDANRPALARLRGAA
jgi:hypothetical protein